MKLLRGLAVVLALALGAGALPVGTETDHPISSARPRVAGLRRGSLQTHSLLSGTLEAVRSAQITAPRVPNGELQIRWMEDDGALVTAGQKVLEFDNANFAGDLEDKKLTASQKEKELRRLEAQARADAAEKEFTVEDRRVAMEKSRLEADVPQEILPLREFEEKQVALERATTEYEKAREDLETHLRTKEKEIAVEKLALDEMRYEIHAAEEAIDALVLEAPRDGVLVIGDIPWEGRKIQVGDTVWPGFLLLTIPDLSEMRVEARLSDVDDGKVRPGMSAVVTLDALPEIELAGTIVSVTPVAQETSPRSLRRAFAVSVSLARTDPERMRPGMAARVTVLTQSQDDVLLVPRSALDLSRTPPRARLASGDETEVSIGGCDLFDCIVEDGLQPETRLAGEGLR